MRSTFSGESETQREYELKNSEQEPLLPSKSITSTSLAKQHKKRISMADVAHDLLRQYNGHAVIPDTQQMIKIPQINSLQCITLQHIKHSKHLPEDSKTKPPVSKFLRLTKLEPKLKRI
jgi:hypothetical protein